MYFEGLKKLKDVRDTLKKHPDKTYMQRPLSSITHLAIHHSLTKTGSAEAFARYHVSHSNWPGIGYHFVVEKDGTIKWCNNLQAKSYHVGNSNRKAVGICLTGDFRLEHPTTKQYNSALKLVKSLMLDLDIQIDNVNGHSEFPDYGWKECPVIDMDAFRDETKRLNNRTGNIIAVDNTEKGDFYIIKRGDTFWSITNKFPNLSIDDLKRLNPEIDPRRIKVGQKIRIKGDVDPVGKKDISYLKVYQALKKLGYTVFEKDNKKYNLNIVGIRNNNSIPDRFDDWICLMWKYKGAWEFKKYKATTDPGLFYLNNPLNTMGTAILKEGRYPRAYRLGLHKGKYKALVQNAPLTVIRDFDRDEVLDFDTGVQQTGFFGLNIHRATANGESVFINKWSAGCQVFANSDDYADFIGICEKASLAWSNSFTYTLINQSDL
jgi:LysM repeat protein